MPAYAKTAKTNIPSHIQALRTMLHINDLTYHIEGRPLFKGASTAIPAGEKVGLVGRNGTGKTTLLRLLSGEISPDDGEIRMPKNARMGIVAQEAPGTDDSLLDTVLMADTERHNLLEEAETATDPDRIAQIHIRLADIGAHTAEARAATILSGLGFDEKEQATACKEFSGGWRMRVALAAILFAEPDLLLLDEPSNYLDLEGSLWLENYIRTYPHTAIIVSHDRDLLNQAVTAIVHLDNQRLQFYRGGYDRFEEMRRQQAELQVKLKRKQDDQRKHMQAFVDRFRASANKAKQAQSRLKALEKLKPIAAQTESEVAPFFFPDPEKKLANPLLKLDEANVGYEEGNDILKDLSLNIDIDDRIGLLGSNGNGKSTFAKLLEGRLKATGGKRKVSKKMTTGFFAQHQMDDLSEKHTPYEEIAKLMADKTEAQKRAKLGQLGFGIQKADTKFKNLSGGEKARILFALASFHGPHLLILDEPTNHLDVDSREALIHALNDYQGAVILISHDRHLISACVDRLWIVRGGTVKKYDGDIETYRLECLAERGVKQKQKKAARAKEKREAKGLSKEEKKKQRVAIVKARKSLIPLRMESQALEKKVNSLTSTLGQVDALLADNNLYAEDPDRATRLTRERGLIAKAIEEQEAKWFEAQEVLEKAKSKLEG